MACFTTRIQLDGEPPEAAYDRLHRAMRAQGYSRYVKSKTGVWHRLPKAEYFSRRFSTRKAALEAAKAAASSIQPDFRVLVTEGTMLTWYGLDRVTEEVARGD